MGATNKRRHGHRHRHIPAELVSEILLNLPTKSLLRFSSVSKSWNSIILCSTFVRRHLALHSHERIAIVSGDGNGGVEATIFLIPPTSSHNPTIEAAELVCPFGDGEYHIKALCGELWLVRARELLYLWNPSMRTYKEVRMPPTGIENDYFLGLGYESEGDEYKILKIPIYSRGKMFEVYSTRNDSWRSIEGFSNDTWINRTLCVVVSGKLHWMTQPYYPNRGYPAIISFDLSTEKFGEVALPMKCGCLSFFCVAGMSVLKGKLCLSHDRSFSFALDI